MARALPLKRKRFAHKFVETQGNGVRSYQEAGYQGNYNVCGVEAHRLLKDPKVQAEIKRVISKVFQGDIMGAQEVLGRLSKHARASLADVLNDSGEFDLEAAKLAQTDDLLKKLKVRKLKDGSIEHEYELHDPQNALVQLARVHKLLTDRVETEDKTDRDPVTVYMDTINAVAAKVPGFTPLTYEQAQKFFEDSVRRASLKIA